MSMVMVFLAVLMTVIVDAVLLWTVPTTTAAPVMPPLGFAARATGEGRGAIGGAGALLWPQANATDDTPSKISRTAGATTTMRDI
jgi:hypothetical protein